MPATALVIEEDFEVLGDTTLDGNLTVLGTTSLQALSAASLTLAGSYTTGGVTSTSLSVSGTGGATAATIFATGTGITAVSAVGASTSTAVEVKNLNLTGTAMSITGNVYTDNMYMDAFQMLDITDTVIGPCLWIRSGLIVTGATILYSDLYVGNGVTSGTIIHSATGNVETTGALTVVDDAIFLSLPTGSHGGGLKYLLIDTADGSLHYQ